MTCNDADFSSGQCFIDSLDSVRRIGGAVGVVVIREQRNTKFGKGVEGRIRWDFGEEEEVNG